VNRDKNFERNSMKLIKRDTAGTDPKDGSVSRQLGIVNRDKKLRKKLNEIDKT